LTDVSIRVPAAHALLGMIRDRAAGDAFNR
jgi:hypothetical protein